ncbi:MAG: exosortase/archaeosortase family protein [Fimbriimonadaceae bacterium]|nr:exosortase/archaeosortase family protein [Fimbriimonadaceae bacterium]
MSKDQEAVMSGQGAPEPAAAPAAPGRAGPKFDFEAVLTGLKRPESLATIGLAIAAILAFLPLFQFVWPLWLDSDSYYQHGLLIPFAAAYIIWSKWDKLQEIPVKGSWMGLVLLIPVLYLTVLANRTVMPLLLSVLFVAALLCLALFVAGWKWTWGLAPGIGFLILGLPILDRYIDQITFKLQVISTDTAEFMLKGVGLSVLRFNDTVLQLDNFDLNIAEACSGLKTTIAVSAAVVFFMLITRLRWWGYVLLSVVAIPLSIIVNGFRIALIGLVGNSQGAEAGIAFHDYSGYIALAVCFAALWGLTKFVEDRS